MLGPAPSASGDPSIWYADVAAPQRKDLEKSYVMAPAVGGNLSLQRRTHNGIDVCIWRSLLYCRTEYRALDKTRDGFPTRVSPLRMPTPVSQPGQAAADTRASTGKFSPHARPARRGQARMA